MLVESFGRQGIEGVRLRERFLRLLRGLPTGSIRRMASTDSQRVQAEEMLARLLADGEAQKARWVLSGELVPIDQVARAWAMTIADVEERERRGELFSLDVEGKRHYARELLSVDPEKVAVINLMLSGCRDAASLLVFWKRRHGVLGGRTVVEVLRNDGASGLLEVRALAAAHAEAW